jgi:hypothetical protein
MAAIVTAGALAGKRGRTIDQRSRAEKAFAVS